MAFNQDDLSFGIQGGETHAAYSSELDLFSGPVFEKDLERSYCETIYPQRGALEEGVKTLNFEVGPSIGEMNL